MRIEWMAKLPWRRRRILHEGELIRLIDSAAHTITKLIAKTAMQKEEAIELWLKGSAKQQILNISHIRILCEFWLLFYTPINYIFDNLKLFIIQSSMSIFLLLLLVTKVSP